MEETLDRWAAFLGSLMTPQRVRRGLLVGLLTGAITFLATLFWLPPQPRWTYSLGTLRPATQTLVGFSPQGRWLAVVGYRGVPENEVLRIWDLQSGQSSPRHTVVLPWQPPVSDGPPQSYQDASIFQWSPDDRELLTCGNGPHYRFVQIVRFMDLESGIEAEPWSYPESVWRTSEFDRLPDLNAMSIQRVEYSPGGGWLILRRDNHCAIAGRHNRQIVLALDNVDHALIQPNDRHLLVQDWVDPQLATDSIRNEKSNWTDYDLVTGQKTPVDAKDAPFLSVTPRFLRFSEVVSADGRYLARLGRDRLRRDQLHLFALPLAPPWKHILVSSISVMVAIVLLMELGIGWWSGFEILEATDSEEIEI